MVFHMAQVEKELLWFLCHAAMWVAMGSLCKVQLLAQYFPKFQQQVEDSTFRCSSETIQYLDLEY